VTRNQGYEITTLDNVKLCREVEIRPNNTNVVVAAVAAAALLLLLLLLLITIIEIITIQYATHTNNTYNKTLDNVLLLVPKKIIST